MKLAQVLEGVPVIKLFQTMFGRMVVTHDIEVSSLQYDSRKVSRNDCFVALRGTANDGHRFVLQAISQGATVVVLEDETVLPDSLCMHTGVVKAVVGNAHRALAVMAANVYHHPARTMKMAGVTGTNGKTTTTHILRSIFASAGWKPGMIGTIEYRMENTSVPATHTTPESLELHELLGRMASEGCRSVSMEVSSHALHQSRVYGIGYDVAIFTNLTQDHLDYHGTMEAYFLAKKTLFDTLPAGAAAVVNADDPWSVRLTADTPGKVMTYAIAGPADVRAENVSLSIEGLVMDVRHQGSVTTVRSPLVGHFNVYNTLAAYAAGLALNIPAEAIVHGITGTPSVKGRFERVASPDGWTAIIDYAHTPDALEKCLTTLRGVLPAGGRIITVFGAGGDRDRTKRPLMGRTAASLSDVAIVTSDNPRTEDPDRIIDDIVAGIDPGRTVVRQANRRDAIHAALGMARSGDAVLIAGKGHEEYQVVGTERLPFSDRRVVEEYIGGRGR